MTDKQAKQWNNGKMVGSRGDGGWKSSWFDSPEYPLFKSDKVVRVKLLVEGEESLMKRAIEGLNK